MQKREPDAEAPPVVAAPAPAEGPDAAQALGPLVTAALRRGAGAQLRRGAGAAIPIRPTELVHEAFLRLARAQPGRWQDRARFGADAAAALRRILAERARRRAAAGRAVPVQIDGEILAAFAPPAALDALAVDAALQRLEAQAPRQARLIELRCFGGLSTDEVAAVLGVPRGLIEREWRRARAALGAGLAGAEPDEGAAG